MESLLWQPESAQRVAISGAMFCEYDEFTVAHNGNCNSAFLL